MFEHIDRSAVHTSGMDRSLLRFVRATPCKEPDQP